MKETRDLAIDLLKYGRSTMEAAREAADSIRTKYNYILPKDKVKAIEKFIEPWVTPSDADV